jgi:hypothetical protein
MYTNIASKDACTIVNSLLKRHSADLEGCSIEGITDLLKFVLSNNYFSYEGWTFQQISGLAMGTSCAPVVSNLYCAFFEKALLQRYSKITFYRRYIDDIFLIFKGTEADLRNLFNTFEIKGLKITWESSNTSMHFLDVLVFKQKNSIATTVYRKWLNKYMYIPWSSAHPISVKKAFVKAERTRLRTICSNDQDFYDCEHFFFANLLRRGYPKQTLIHWFSQSLVIKPETQEVKMDKTLLPSTYNPVWEYISMSTLSQELLNNLVKAKLPLLQPFSKGFLLSLKRTRNFQDFFNSTNLTILEHEASL